MTAGERRAAVGLSRDWKRCTACSLHESATKHATYRGEIPCDVLWIGEAPGEVEDLLGEPFVGPSGKLLDRIVADVEEEANMTFRSAFVNVVSCLPQADDPTKVRPPKVAEAKACASHVNRFLRFARPRFVVFVGNTAAKNQGLYDFGPRIIATEAIEHPSSILRKAKTQEYETAYWRAVRKVALSLMVPF